jgi:hypothetical protein
MKSTDTFKKTIKAKLQEMGEQDPLFAEKLKNEKKNINDCITYILNTVQKSGCNGFTDDEVFGMAAHYYDEEKIEIGKPISNANVVVNHAIDLTDEELKEARAKAKEKAIADELERLKKKQAPKKPETKVEQPSLF